MLVEVAVMAALGAATPEVWRVFVVGFWSFAGLYSD